MMSRRLVLVLGAIAAAVGGAGPLAVSGAAGAWAVPAARGAAVPAAGSWGRAIEVPGPRALNRGGRAGVTEVSCPSSGNCVAGGSYKDGHRHDQGFVAAEKNGVWGKAVGVPGLGVLNKGGNAYIGSVSCALAGDCAAGGSYKDGHRHDQVFVVVEKDGVWGRAIEVPGLGALNKGGAAEVGSVSCGGAGNCAAGGYYTDGHRNSQGFVAVEKNGRWGKAIEVPGLGALNKGGAAEVGSVSCGAAGNCAAGGYYIDRPHHDTAQGFVVVEKNGRWGKAIEVPGLGTLNKGAGAGVLTVSCASAGNCVAGGDYTDRGDIGHGFVAAEKNGRWGKATDVPGLKALDEGEGTEVDTVSCASAGNCAAGGTYAYPYTAGFVVSEKNGVWGKATDAGLSGRIAGVDSVSCASPGNCAAGGFYSDDTGGINHGWVAAERNGRWGQPLQVPGLRALNKGGDADVGSVSCGAPGNCAAGGHYTDGHRRSQGFVAVEK